MFGLGRFLTNFNATGDNRSWKAKELKGKGQGPHLVFVFPYGVIYLHSSYKLYCKQTTSFNFNLKNCYLRWRMLPHPLTTNSPDKRMLFGEQKTGQDSPGNGHGYGLWDMGYGMWIWLWMCLSLWTRTESQHCHCHSSDVIISIVTAS